MHGTVPASAEALFERLEAGIAGSDPPARLAAFGGSAVRVRLHGFGGDAYGEALAAAAPGSETLFAIDVIDGAACGIDRPRPGWSVEDFGPKRLVPGWSDDRRALFLLRTEQGLAVADWRKRRAIVWLPDAAAVPWYEKAAPFRWLFDCLAERSGQATLHAACVGRGSSGLLIAGAGGSGKSTLALAAAGEGFSYVGDDYCLLGSDARTVHALYTSAKWKRDAAVLPEWLAEVAAPEDDAEHKKVAMLGTARPACLTSALTVSAIVLPAIDGGLASPTIEPLSPARALQALAASSIAQSEAQGATLVSLLGRLARSVPSFRLGLTRSLRANVAMLEELPGAG